MFGKRRVQKNLKKRNLNDEESNNNESEILGNGCIDDAVSHVVTPLVSAHELKRRKITGKAPIVVVRILLSSLFNIVFFSVNTEER